MWVFSGELTVRYPESQRQSRIRRQASPNPANNVFILTVRAYDLGSHQFFLSKVEFYTIYQSETFH